MKSGRSHIVKHDAHASERWRRARFGDKSHQKPITAVDNVMTTPWRHAAAARESGRM